MVDYRYRDRSETPGDYNFIAGRLEFLAPASEVWIGIERGDGTLGTKRASSITNCTPENVKAGVTIDDVLGTFNTSSGEFATSAGGFYSKMALTANKLLKGKGQGIIITHIVPGTYDPATGVVTGESTEIQNGIGAVIGWDNRLIDGTLIKNTDKHLLLSPVNTLNEFLTPPVLGDKITDEAGTKYTMVPPFKRISPAGTVVLYSINLRA